MTEQTNVTFELSPSQEQAWLAAPDGPFGRVQAVIALGPDATPESVRAALAASVARHEILRTTFTHRPGIRVPLQTVAEALEPAWQTAATDGDEALRALAGTEREAPLDFAAGPLLRAVFLSLGDGQRALLLTASTLILDPGSLAVLAAELTGADAVEDPLQYADYAAWQAELQDGDDDEAKSARAFWAQIAQAPPAVLPFTGPVAPGATVRREPVVVSADAVARLREVAARYDVDLLDVVGAAWQAVLARSAGDADLTVAWLGDARRHEDLEGAVGALNRPVPLRSRLAPESTFAELVGQVAADRRQAAVWQDYVPADAAALPVGLVTLHAGAGALRELIVSGTPAAVTLTAIASPAALDLALVHEPAAVPAALVAPLAGRLATLLDAAAADPSRPVDALELLAPSERETVTRVFATGDELPAPAQTLAVHELVARHAAQHPDRVAVTAEQASLTYGELDRRANQLAHRLRAAGVQGNQPVGLCADRSADMVVGLLGILKAGGAYVPLHHEHPAARLRHQLQSAGAQVLVTQEPLLDAVQWPGQTICLDRDRAELESQAHDAPPVSGSPDLAYIIFTSGSTGEPKGVAVTHANLSAYAHAITARLDAEAEPLSFAMVTSVSTDLGNTSLYGALASGGTLVLVDPATAADPGAFAALARSTPIDVLKITPSHLGALLSGGDGGLLPRRWLVLGGERAPWDLVETVRALGSCRVLNHYGPTEATIGATTFEVTDGPGIYQPGTVPIGRPLAGDRCYVLDARRAPVGVGAPGRLHIAGAGVAQGYIGAPELTAERFLDDPFAGGAPARMYDTGDVVRWLPDGTLEFLGRVDEQVKIRGYRVEPAEVEVALRRHDAVREAVVIAGAGPAGDTRLVAYCAVDPATRPEALSEHLTGWLPEFMVPAAIVTLDSLPRTPSGKVDRQALPELELAGEHPAGFVAPQTPVQQTLAGIWSRVLGIDRIGVEDDFFVLGGHSLLATQVVAQVRSDFAVELPLHSLFTYPTIASLAEQIVAMMGDSDADETARLMAELEGLSDEEAERLLAGESPPPPR